MPKSLESEASYEIAVEECGRLRLDIKIDVTSKEAR
jgi:hypothetical protein